jgi:hypothetical protein
MATSTNHSESNMADSEAFEFVDHETASQASTNDLGTESAYTPSVSDLASEQNTTEDEDEEEDEQEADRGQDENVDDDDAPPTTTASLQYAESVLANPSNASHTPSASLISATTANCAPQPIVFQETASVLHDQVSRDTVPAKYYVRDLDVEETAALRTAMHFKDEPKKLTATIRQSMSTKSLPIQEEPYHLLLVGDLTDDEADEVIHKISSAILTSEDQSAATETDATRTIVRLSDFESSRSPQVGLIPTTKYRIKTSLCIAASVEVPTMASNSEHTVYTLKLDDGTAYHTAVLHSQDETITSTKPLPELAIVYFADDEDEAEQAKRDAALRFLTLHRVPTICISESVPYRNSETTKRYSRSGNLALHTSLECAYGEHTTVYARLPVDLGTFLNIDSKQLNRHLAYLSGRRRRPSIDRSDSKIKTVENLPLKLDRSTIRKLAFQAWTELTDRREELLYPFVVLAIALFLSALLVPRSKQWQPPASPATLDITTTQPLPTSTLVQSTTVTVSLTSTSTKTIEIAKVRPTTVTSAVPPFGGFLTDAVQKIVPVPELTETICSVEVHGKSEILVRVPSATKASWLSKAAIQVDILRDGSAVKSKLTSVDEGILVEINQQDAHGVLNVSVITTRKPKVNETFAVDFGQSLFANTIEAGAQLYAEISNMLTGTYEEGQRLVNDVYGSTVAGLVTTWRKDAESAGESIKNAGKVAHEYSKRLGSEAATRGQEAWTQVQGLLDSELISKALQETREEIIRDLCAMKHAKDNAALALLKAQITSRLWWLKARGKEDEYAVYEFKAAEFLQAKTEKLLKQQAQGHDFEESKPTGRRWSSRSRCKTHVKGKACRSCKGAKDGKEGGGVWMPFA